MRVQFGTHYLLTLRQQERPRVRAFYVDLLGCRIEAHDHNVTANIPENIDLFHFPDGEVFGVQCVSDSDTRLTAKEYGSGKVQSKADGVINLSHTRR